MTIFLWLVLHKQFLTWDNLLKRGFIGPSQCILCEEQEETMDHLLDQCSFSSELWDRIASICKRIDCCRGNISKTIKHWHNHPYQNPILNRIWQLILGFLIWNIWKERNLRIFEGRVNFVERVWASYKQHIKETTMLNRWYEQDLQAIPTEKKSSWKIG